MTVQYSAVQYGTLQCSTVQYSTIQYSTVQYSTIQYSEHSTVLLHHVLPLCVHTGGKSAHCVPGKQTLTYLEMGFLFCQNTRRSGRSAPILLAPSEGWGYVVHAVEPCTTLGVG